MEILAKVKFNDSVAIVLENSPKLTYYKDGGYIWGTDGLFYVCYVYDRPSKGFRAFGGRKFTIPLNTGEIVECNGQWWSGGQSEISKKLNVDLGHATVGVLKDLKKCYVFSGYEVDINVYKKLLDNDLPIYPYWDYEKVIKFDDMRSNLYKKIFKLERDKKNLIKKVREKHNTLKRLKLDNQIIVNYEN